MKSRDEIEKQIHYLIGKLNSSQNSFFDECMREAPSWIFESFDILEIPKNTKFIRENETLDKIYILAEGRVKASDYRISGIEYDFIYFNPVQMFGNMEIFLEQSYYRTTLVTVTNCIFITLTRENYEKWMKNDINTLLVQTKSMMNYILEQSRKERIYLFLQGSERLFVLFVHLYKETKKDRFCTIELTRQELSDGTGLCIKTIDRAIKRLIAEKYIKKEGRKITISEEQYLRMEEHIATQI